MSSLSHDQIRASLPEYALGVLEGDEHREIAAHIRTCALCQAELAESQTMLAGLGTGVRTEPPASLRSRVLQYATASSLPIAPRMQTAQARTSRWVPAALAASLLLACLAGGYAWSLRNQLASAQQTAADAEAQISVLQAELREARTDRAVVIRALNVLDAPNLLRVDLQGQPRASGAAGRAFWSATAGVFFRASGLPPLEAGRVYQLWTITGSSAASAGVMSPDATGAVTHTSQASASLPDAFGVTIEPAGGSSAPTLPVVMFGRVN